MVHMWECFDAAVTLGDVGFAHGVHRRASHVASEALETQCTDKSVSPRFSVVTVNTVHWRVEMFRTNVDDVGESILVTTNDPAVRLF